MKILKYLLPLILAVLTICQSIPGSCKVPTWESQEHVSELGEKVKILAGRSMDDHQVRRISKAVLRETDSKSFPSPDQVLAVIKTESNFIPTAGHRVGPSLGLMQVNVGIHRLKNPYSVDENIRAGVKLLREYHSKTKDETMALMYYNMGPAGTKRACRKKCVSQYVAKVNHNLKQLETLKG